MTRPLRVGLTGSIGMGKSTAARMFAEHGLPVWDADAAVHRLYAPGGAGAAALSSVAPSAVSADSGVDRAALKTLIAEDPGLLAQVEAVIHPLVAEDRNRFIDAAKARAVILDIPLLFETGAEAQMDLTLVVSTDEERQKARVMARPGMTEAHFHRILANQMPDAEKHKRADLIILSDTMDTARRDVAQAVGHIETLWNQKDAGNRP
ncbi:MAG: dephospho-CoA kinase [Pseudomonadota bacterium]